MRFPVKVFKQTKDGLKLVRIYTVKYLEKRSDEKLKKLFIHPSVSRLTKKEKEALKKNV